MRKAPLEPTVERYPADGLIAGARCVFFATRPKFLTASVLPVAVGTALGFAGVRQVNWGTACLALAATVLAHAATNVYNDVGDEINGTDAANVGRVYPYTGGSRFIQNGVLSQASALGIAIGLAGAALVTGLWLFWLRGAPVLAFGVVGLALGLLYSQPGVQLSGRGLGELACGLGLGMLPVIGAYWLQSDVIDADALLIGTMVAIWASLILLVNEVPDRAADAQVGKRTLVVRFGATGAGVLYALETTAVLACGAMLLIRGALPAWAAIPVAGLVVVGIFTGRAIAAAEADRTAMRDLIERTLAIHGVGCAFLIVALLLR